MASFVAAAALLAGLLWASKRGHVGATLVTKTPLSLLFVLTAVRASHPDPRFAATMIVGLALAVAGDVLLALTFAWAFRAGLVAFLFGHLAYVAAFATLGLPGPAALPYAVVTIAASAAVLRWLWPHLGTMRGPVIAYVVVITVMVVMASGVLVDAAHPPALRAAVFSGAVLFYLSDITVARNRFVAEGFANRALGLPLYYAGQFVLALAVGLAAPR